MHQGNNGSQYEPRVRMVRRDVVAKWAAPVDSGVYGEAPLYAARINFKDRQN